MTSCSEDFHYVDQLALGHEMVSKKELTLMDI